MAHLEPLARDAAPQLEQVFVNSEAAMGFLPNSMLTMAHMPQLAAAFSLLAGTVFGVDLKASLATLADRIPDQDDAQDNLPPTMVQLIAFTVSVRAGCGYCQAHTSHNATRFGLPEDKLAGVLDPDGCTALDDDERAVIKLALAAAAVPNESTQAHFDALRPHFNPRQVAQIVGVISLFGFLNRWNDTMATTLEQTPVNFASEKLGAFDWQVGKHG